LFAFARLRKHSDPSQIVFLLLSMLALVLAYLSWKLVEAPFRVKSSISRAQVFLFAAFGTAILLAFGFAGNYTDGFRNRLPPNLEWESLGSKLDAMGDVCKLSSVDQFNGVNACFFGS
jgi:hypothetical protein